MTRATGGDSVYDIVVSGVAYRVHEFTRTVSATLNDSGSALVATSNTVGSVTVTDGMVVYVQDSSDADQIGNTYQASGSTDNWTWTLYGMTVTSSGNADILVVAGGGGAGKGTSLSRQNAGGGGAGGLIYRPGLSISGSIACYVGKGGNGATATSSAGQNGIDSQFDTLLAKGGGGGGSYDGGYDGVSGGSGGGGRWIYPGFSSGGSSTQSSQSGDSGTYGFGFAGGSKTNQWAADGGCGGGGAGSAAADNSSTGYGGSGKDYSGTFGTGVGVSGVFAAGGSAIASGANGAANTGNGGDGSDKLSGNAGGSGGSGIVIVRYVLSTRGIPVYGANLWRPNQPRTRGLYRRG